MSAPITLQEFHVDPARLASGAWCHTRDRQIGEGDISASYSADKIGLEGRVRSPFKWQNALWVSVGGTSKGDYRAVQAYRIIERRFFDGTPITYQESVSAPKPLEGFYHGMAVKWGKLDCVLIGPASLFLPSEKKAAPEQANMFDLL
ncbi:hypothetical protein [Celeribacter indicus]|uniref:Uncharacterized protein n=1 Tax=Celeribacter indicus TaxID=1208324 RepID=A0A0B5E3M3_9RHOB|nr:hypothetical protein [Celeribacter indicus]AJE47980.1 hypothetical protein P73_3265 [Celeribacter indicus]SDW28579.1 hypothetical protein SAMN05443573_102255 [Celeribacter indicus]